MTNPLKKLPVISLLAAAVLASFIGYQVGVRRELHKLDATAGGGSTKWTCAMHPQIMLPKSGMCPVCFMPLIPLESGEGEDPNPRVLTMSAAAAGLANIQTVPVQKQIVTNTLRMVGKVTYDETRLVHITARVPGRLDRLYVDYTGVAVSKGDHLVMLYSPDLVVAQQELLQSLRSQQRLGPTGANISLSQNLKSAEEKLRLLGLLPDQIEQIKTRGTTTDHVTIYSPTSGIVVQKNANEGMYVETGTRIYTIAELKHLWVTIDAYESDLAWLRYGQQVEFTTETYPGEIFAGRIVFIDPVLNEKTHTVRVRVNVPNEAGRLKPGMFVRARVLSRMAAGGRIVTPSLAGKWISPMHPEIVKDHPGTCDICGMPLVPAEELGLVPGDAEAEPSLVIPASAPLITGKRAIVYVRLPDREKPTFEGRDVVLGPRTGDQYIVYHGLEEGEQVVVAGNFLIDADLQIKGRVSMMNPEPRATHKIPAEFARQLASLVESYFRLQGAMSKKGHPEVPAAAVELRLALAQIEDHSLGQEASEQWRSARTILQNQLTPNWEKMPTLAQNVHFQRLSQTMLGLVGQFGNPSAETVYKAFCPMAFDNTGAFWLQPTEQIVNPYFSGVMLRCGSVKRSFNPTFIEASAPQ